MTSLFTIQAKLLGEADSKLRKTKFVAGPVLQEIIRFIPKLK